MACFRKEGTEINMNLFQYDIVTKKPQEFIDITYLVNQAVKESNIDNGIAVVYCPHTTAAITINENSDSDVVDDIISALNKVFPVNGNYKHFEGNSHAHLKSSCLGVEKTIIIKDGKLILGTWQSIYFCEFDGPRNRRIFIKII